MPFEDQDRGSPRIECRQEHMIMARLESSSVHSMAAMRGNHGGEGTRHQKCHLLFQKPEMGDGGGYNWVYINTAHLWPLALDILHIHRDIVSLERLVICWGGCRCCCCDCYCWDGHCLLLCRFLLNTTLLTRANAWRYNTIRMLLR